MSEFQRFVNENVRWFRGHAPETEQSLDAAERELGLSVPSDVRWLLQTHGYWHATGISSLSESVEQTKAARRHLGMPERYFVLYDHQDGGVILIDTVANADSGECRVYNVAWEFVPDEIQKDIVYTSYLEYVRDVLSKEQDLIDEDDIDYDPTRYRF